MSDIVFLDVVFYIFSIIGVALIWRYTNIETALGVLLITAAVRMIEYKNYLEREKERGEKK